MTHSAVSPSTLADSYLTPLFLGRCATLASIFARSCWIELEYLLFCMTRSANLITWLCQLAMMQLTSFYQRRRMCLISWILGGATERSTTSQMNSTDNSGYHISIDP